MKELIKRKTIRPTINQERVAKRVIEKVRKGAKISMRKEMLEVGYSKGYAQHPSRLTKSPAWLFLMSQHLGDTLLAKTHRELLLDKNWRARKDALDMAYKLRGRYKNDESSDLAGDSIKKLLIQIYNDKRPLINPDNAKASRSAIRDATEDERPVTGTE